MRYAQGREIIREPGATIESHPHRGFEWHIEAVQPGDKIPVICRTNGPVLDSCEPGMKVKAVMNALGC